MKLTVDSADRIDKALAKHFPEAGRRQLAQLFDEGCVRVAGKLAHKGDRVVSGDVIELSREPVGGDALRPAPDPNVPIVIIFERPDIVAVNKPAGIPSQPLRPGEQGTIANGIVHRYPECRAIGNDPRDGGLVHRLDIGTSGVLIAARTAAAHRSLRDAFGAGLVHKEYLAIVENRPVSRECDAPLAQRGKRVVIDHTDGLAAFTAFVTERATATHALVRCTAQSGRMHQVRAHLAHVGAPIVGDTRYGAASIEPDDGFFLHAAKIVLPDAVTAAAPLPDRFARMVEALQLVE